MSWRKETIRCIFPNEAVLHCLTSCFDKLLTALTVLSCGPFGTDFGSVCAVLVKTGVMEWREQSSLSCAEAYLEAQRWIEVSYIRSVILSCL